jgi:hypothetical protein
MDIDDDGKVAAFGSPRRLPDVQGDTVCVVALRHPLGRVRMPTPHSPSLPTPTTAGC